jgi:hypothetical protein
MNPKYTLTLSCLCLCLLVLQFSSLATEKKPALAAIKEEHKSSKKALASRNNNAVRIYPDIIKKIMHVVAKDNEGKEIDFFVFDLQGTLMKHYRMSDGDHKKIDGLERGKYIYSVFCGDEETVTGKFEIR